MLCYLCCVDRRIRVYDTSHNEFKETRCIQAHDVGWSILDLSLRYLCVSVCECVFVPMCMDAWIHACVHHLDTVSDLSTETSLLSHQLHCLHMVDDVLLYPLQPLGTACWTVSKTLHYLSKYFSAISKVTYFHLLIGRPFIKQFALCYWIIVLSLCPVCNRAPLPQMDTAPNFCTMSIVAKQLDGSRCHLVGR